MAMKQTLPFDMSFNKSKSLSKVGLLMSWFAPRGPKSLKFVIFLGNGLFLSIS